MADVTLREYCEEVKELIRSDFYDQAIIISRHILERFPKHVTSYRLLGEACLEKGDYVEAANLFKRVLSVDLEDVIAHVGLSIIYDEQGAVEEAIWQLERAFELTPGNAEIRGELQRLYGERDGIAPPRLKLTPAALGRLYLKEELYQRSVDELKGVLEEDPERADIQVALAEALWRSDQRREAAEVCEDILEELPNCLKANLILGEILLTSGREEEGQALLHTAQALDPENIVAEHLFRDQSPFPFEPVYVRRLDEAELEEEAKEIGPEMPEEEIEPEEALPLTAEAELEEEIPDWLQQLRQAERQPIAEEAPTPTPAEEMPDWLRELEEGIPGKPEEAMVPSEGVLPTPGEEMPVLLHEPEETSEAPRPEEISLPPAAEEEEEASPEVVVEEKPAEKRKPTWGEMEKESPMIAALKEELPAAEEEEVDTSDEAMARLRETMPGESASIEEIMAWMDRSRRIIAEEEAPPDASEAVEEDRGAPPEEAEELPPLPEEAPAWLQQVTAEPVEEELVAPPEEVEAPVEEVAVPAEEEDIPAWLRELRAEAVEEEVLAPADEVEAPLEEVAVPAEEEIPAWLRELRAEAVEEEVVAPPEEVEAPLEEVAVPSEEEIPAWLRELRAEPMEEEVVAPQEEVETPLEEVAVPAEEEEIPAWLRELRAEAVEEEVVAPPQEVEAPLEEMVVPAEEEEIPAWLRELRAEAVEEEVVTPAEEAAVLLEEEAEHILAEEAIPPSFVEEAPLIEIIPVEEEVAEVASVPEKIEEEVTEVAWSIEDYVNHLASRPQDHEARLALARAYLQESDLDEAASHYREIVSSGSLLDEAIDDLEAMADDAPDHLPVQELLADAYMKDGRLQKALDKYRWLRVKLAG